MCERTWGQWLRAWAALGFVVAWIAPAPLSAQDRARLLDRVERFEERWRAASERLERAQAAHRDLPLDTVALGGLRLVTYRDGAGELRNVALGARDSLRAVLGPDTTILGDRTVLLIRRGSTAQPLPGIRYVALSRYPDMTMEIGEVVQSVRHFVWWDLDEELKVWIGTAFSLDTLSTQYTSTYWEFTVSPWSIVRDCIAGDNDACRPVLGLVSVADPATTFYTAAERRLRVEQMRRFASYRRYREGETECREGGDDAACTRILRESPWMVRLELSDAARSTFLQTAQAVGGRGALRRLISSDSLAMGERLSLAAGVPLDSLFDSWRQRLQDARPGQVVLTRTSAWAAFFWVLVLAVGATRSTRWRAS